VNAFGGAKRLESGHFALLLLYSIGVQTSGNTCIPILAVSHCPWEDPGRLHARMTG